MNNSVVNIPDVIDQIMDVMIYEDQEVRYNYRTELRVDNKVVDTIVSDYCPNDNILDKIVNEAKIKMDDADAKIIVSVHEIKIDLDKNIKHIRSGY